MRRSELESKLPALIEEMGIEGMKHEIAEYYETAGLAGFYERIASLPDSEVPELYLDTFADDEDGDFYTDWHQSYIDG